MAKTKKEIFISYTWSKDGFNAIRKFTDILEEKLQEAETLKDIKVAVFYDKNNITADANEEAFLPILTSHLDASEILIILLSPNWLESKWCTWEFEMFTKNKERPIIPILWEEITLENHIPLSGEVKKKVSKIPYITFKNNHSPFDRETIPKEALEMIENLVRKISTHLTS